MRIALSLVLAGLGASTLLGAQEPSPHAPPAAQHVLGFYTGTLPCADCSGIHTELTLFSNGSTSSGTASYWLKETYLGKPEKDATFESGGSWTSQPGAHDPKSIVYHLTEARSRESRYYLKVSDDVLKMLDRSGRPIESKLDYTLRRRPVQEKPLPHAAPPGRYLVGFYTGTVPCADCEGVRVELSLFDGPHKLGGPSYWLKETRLGGPASGTAESSGQWRTDKNREAPGGTLLELLDAHQRYLEHGPDQLKLIQRWPEKFPLERAGTVTRAMGLPAYTNWYEAFGCASMSRGGIDSAAGAVKCGDTVINYDIGGTAGDWCHDKLTLDLSLGRIPMRMCTLDHWRSVPLVVSLPDQDTNLYVDRSTPEDTMVLLAMARNLADLHRAEDDSLRRPADLK